MGLEEVFDFLVGFKVVSVLFYGFIVLFCGLEDLI